MAHSLSSKTPSQGLTSLPFPYSLSRIEHKEQPAVVNQERTHAGRFKKSVMVAYASPKSHPTTNSQELRAKS
jgi:hypothetical protein